MYVRVQKVRQGGRVYEYIHIVEGYRDSAGKVRHRVVANLGRLDRLKDSGPLASRAGARARGRGFTSGRVLGGVPATGRPPARAPVPPFPVPPGPPPPVSKPPPPPPRPAFRCWGGSPTAPATRAPRPAGSSN